MFYAVPTAWVIFTAKTSLDVFSLRQEQVWTFSVLDDPIYDMRCLFLAMGLNALFIVLPHWDNMSQAHRLTHLFFLHIHKKKFRINRHSDWRLFATRKQINIHVREWSL